MEFGSRRRSTTSFVEVAKTSYQLLGILSFSGRERALPPSKEISVPTSTMKLLGWGRGGGEGGSIFREWARKHKIKCRPLPLI